MPSGFNVTLALYIATYIQIVKVEGKQTIYTRFTFSYSWFTGFL
jgi:hypothetical protein